MKFRFLFLLLSTYLFRNLSTTKAMAPSPVTLHAVPNARNTRGSHYDYTEHQDELQEGAQIRRHPVEETDG